jgi:signal transduction histidine kinase
MILTPEQLNRLLAIQPATQDESQPDLDSPFLRLLASMERQRLSRLLTERRCVRGEVVVREGEPGNAMYMIWSGRVVVFLGDVETPTILGYREAGEIIGEMAILEHQPRSASVVALEDLRLLEISQENFYSLMESDPTLGLNIMGMISARLRVSDQARSQGQWSERQLISQVSELESEKQQLLELQRLRQETSDLIIHDLRNPLGSISLAINMLEMVLPEDVLGENRQLMDIAQHGVDKMLRLVESLLEVSRMESGESQFQFVELSLDDMITNLVQGVLVAPERAIKVEKCLPENLPKVMADRDKLERVLQNLMDNALKYTPDGGRVTVAAEVQGENILVSVTDTGLGIPESQRERIFERFAQVQGEKRARRGFGLGLAYCHLAIEAHGGHIWVEPGEGGMGSRFAFTLPLKR